MRWYAASVAHSDSTKLRRERTHVRQLLYRAADACRLRLRRHRGKSMTRDWMLRSLVSLAVPRACSVTASISGVPAMLPTFASALAPESTTFVLWNVRSSFLGPPLALRVPNESTTLPSPSTHSRADG